MEDKSALITSEALEDILNRSIENIGGGMHGLPPEDYIGILKEMCSLLSQKKYIDSSTGKEEVLNSESEKEIVYKLLVLSMRGDFGTFRTGNAKKVLDELRGNNELVDTVLKEPLPTISVTELIDSFKAYFKEVIDSQLIKDVELDGIPYLEKLFSDDKPTVVGHLQREICRFIYTDTKDRKAKLTDTINFVVHTNRRDLVGYEYKALEVIGPLTTAIYILYKKKVIGFSCIAPNLSLSFGSDEEIPLLVSKCSFFGFTEEIYTEIGREGTVWRLLSDYEPKFNDFKIIPKFEFMPIFPIPEDFKNTDIVQKYKEYVNALKELGGKKGISQQMLYISQV